MLNELLNAFDVIEEDDNLKAVIISGAGKGFCAGHNLKEVRSFKIKNRINGDYS